MYLYLLIFHRNLIIISLVIIKKLGYFVQFDSEMIMFYNSNKKQDLCRFDVVKT